MLTEEQQSIVDLVLSDKSDNKIVAVNACAGSGKGLIIGTKILTPNGYVNIENLKVGDDLIGLNGKKTKIIGYFPQGLQNCYKLTFSNNQEIICDENHLWSYHLPYDRQYNKNYRTNNIVYIYNNIKLKTKLGKHKKTMIYLPMVNPVELNEIKYNKIINPYLLGLLIGDGSFVSNHIKITNSEEDIINSIKRLIPNNIILKHINKINYTFISNDRNNIILNEIKKLNLINKRSYEKHIPKEYLFTSIENRLLLLQGLIDTDGHIENNRYEYSTSSEQLKNDIVFLCNTLGLTANVSIKKNTKYIYNKEIRTGRIAYRIYIKPSKIFPKLHKSIKHELKYKKPQCYSRITLKSIEKLNEKYETICLKVDSEDELFVIEGGIVTHNTTLLVNLVDSFKPNNALYLAFNKSVVEEAKKKLKNYNISCNTIHSLAYKYTNYKNIKELSINDLPKNINYETKKLMIECLNNFFLSKYLKLKDFINDNYDDEYLFDLVKPIMQKMINKEIPATFNFLLKIFHLNIVNGINKPEYDLILQDEVQDTMAVTLEIFKLLECKKKVIVGDTYQNIYNFMNTVNAFRELNKDEIILKKLTKSFRCSPNIAKQVEKYGKEYLQDDFIFRGTDVVDSNGITVTLVRHNVALIRKLQETISSNKDFKLLRQPDEIFGYIISLLLASLGKSVYNNQYKYLESYYYDFEIHESKTGIVNERKSKQYRYFDYLLEITDFDEMLQYGIDTITIFNKDNINIFELLEETKKRNNKDSKYIISTVHTYKGLEADIVYIDKSLINSVESAQKKNDDLDYLVATKSMTEKEKLKEIKDNPEKYIEPYNLYYVALSRAKFECIGNNL